MYPPFFFSVDYLEKSIKICSILLVIYFTNNGRVWFVGKKRSRSILYSISTNTQWGLIPFSMSECIDIWSSFKGPIRKNFPLFYELIQSMYKI